MLSGDRSSRRDGGLVAGEERAGAQRDGHNDGGRLARPPLVSFLEPRVSRAVN
jgi:hypothetical protein